MAIKIAGFNYGQADEGAETLLEVKFAVTDDFEAVKLITSLHSLLELLRQDPERMGKPLVDADASAPAALPAAAPARTSKRQSAPPVAAPSAPPPTTAPAAPPPVAPAPVVAAKPIEEKVTPPLAPDVAPPPPNNTPEAAPKPAVARAPAAAAAAAPTPAAAPAAPLAVPQVVAVPGLSEQAPSAVTGAKSFREVVVYFLGMGISDPALVYSACAAWRAQVPIIDRMMQPQADPDAEILPRIVRALEVIQKKA